METVSPYDRGGTFGVVQANYQTQGFNGQKLQKPPKIPGVTHQAYEHIKPESFQGIFSQSRKPNSKKVNSNSKYKNTHSQKSLKQPVSINIQKVGDMNSDWQKLFSQSPMSPTAQQREADQNFNFKNPRSQSTNQGFMQARSASLGTKRKYYFQHQIDPSTLNVGDQYNNRPFSKQGQSTRHGIEQKDLNKALSSIQSFVKVSRDASQKNLLSPGTQGDSNAPRLLQMARGKDPKKEFTFGIQNNNPASKTGGLISPSTREGTAMISDKNIRLQIPKSRSKSPDGNDDLFDISSPQSRIKYDLSLNPDLQLQQEIAQQIKVNKLLTLNNYSKMLQNVERVKKDLYHDHKILQNVKLVSTLQHNMHEEVFKARGPGNHHVLYEFVNATDKVIKTLIPQQDAWKIKNHVIKNLNLKIHTAELVNTIKSSKSRGSNQRKLSDLMQDEETEYLNSQSISRSPPPSQGMKRPKTQMHNGYKLQKKSPKHNEQLDSNQDDSDTSYMAYVEALTRRANMQQMISQNIIKVKYVKEEDRIQEIRKAEAENQSALLKNNSIDSLDVIVQIKKDMKDGSQSPKSFVFDEEKLIRDFISERDMFISRHKQKKRIIFNQESVEQSKADVLEIGQIPLRDFIKKNRIHPKIFSFDRSLEDYRPQMNKRIYYLQKSVMLLQTQKIGQARTFLINAVKEFPGDIPLTFNKGLMHFLNGEYMDGAKLFYSLLMKIKMKNLLLINLCLCHLHSGEYEEVLDLQSEIEKKDNYLDFNEKQLRMMGLLAREKLKVEEPQRYEKYMKIQRDKELREQLASNPPKNRIMTPIQQVRPSTKGQGQYRQQNEIISSNLKRVSTPAQGHRYRDVEDKEITIVDENKPGVKNKSHKESITDSNNQKGDGGVDNFSLLIQKNNPNLTEQQRKNIDRNQGVKVQFSQQFSEAFSSLDRSSDDELSSNEKQKNIKKKLSMSGVITQQPPQLDIQKVYEIDDQALTSEKGEVITKEEQNILADIMFLRQDFESENKLIEYIGKIEKRKQGSTKVFLDKRDEYFMKKYKRGVNALTDRNSKFYFKKYLKPEDENDKYTRKVPKIIKPEPQKLLSKQGSELENEEEKLMRLLGMPQDKIDARLLKHKLQQGMKDAFTKVENTSLIMDKPNPEQEKADFAPKTMDFIQFIFREFGIKEVMIPGVENTSIIEDIRNIEAFNQYINRLSEFMTTKTSYFADEKQRMQAEEEQQTKIAQEKRKKLKGYDSDNDEGMLILPQEKKDEDDPDRDQNKNMIEVFQNVLEIKYIEMFGDQNYEDAAFYQQLLQKLNAIDLLQLFLRNSAKKILGGEKLLTFKKELSMGMLQIFREEICKNELNIIKVNDSKFIKEKVNFDMIDRTLRKLRFFKNFAQNIRLRLYQVARYELVPPGRIIAHQEELESHIFVIISGIASLTVKYLESNESYSGMLIYPGDAVGDANIKDKIVISKGRGETKWYVSSVKECDVLVFERRQFTDVLFKDMMDSLYEKIMCMRNSEFFENLSPYAMVILCSNIELHEYSYGDVILRQNTEPDECYIIISGECKLVLETIIYKQQEEKSAKKGSNVMKFGSNNYNPSQRYGKGQNVKKNRGEDEQLEKILVNQKKLNEKFSFQNEVLDFQGTNSHPHAELNLSDRGGSQSPVYNAPVINSTDIPFSQQKQGTKMIAYRHHLPYDKVVAGKVLCSRALLEKEYIKKFINKKLDYFNDQLYGPKKKRSSSQGSSSSDDNINSIIRSFPEKRASDHDNEDQLLSFSSNHRSNLVSPKSNNNFTQDFNVAAAVGSPKNNLANNKGGLRKSPTNRMSILLSKRDNSQQQKLPVEQDTKGEMENMYQALMKSQLTVIADQAVVKVLKLNRKSKKYLSDPLKAMIDNRIYETKFKDYDRPFKNEIELQKFIDGQRKWEQYKDKVSKNIVQKYAYK